MTLVGRFALERTVFIYLFMYGCGRVHVCVHFFLFQFALGASDASAAPRRADTDDEPYRKRHRWEIRVGAIRPRGSLAEETQTGLFRNTPTELFFWPYLPVRVFPRREGKRMPLDFLCEFLPFCPGICFEAALHEAFCELRLHFSLLPSPTFTRILVLGSRAHFCSRPA